MEGSGISGEVRVVRGVPLRVWPNRTDTSWAEEYAVRAAPPVGSIVIRPKRVRGPWTSIGGVFADRVQLGKWRIRYERGVEAALDASGAEHREVSGEGPDEDEVGLSFDDSLGEMADAWRRSRGAE